MRKALLHWYANNRRDLPWRRTRDAYAIWVSEIMLQQTRVAAVLEHYREFLRLFPTVETLASAREDRVLAAWSGLGYYRRARALHRAAKVVASEFAGKLPRTSSELRLLPGIGRYTAAAIASIAFAEPTAVVDGNVERVLSRLDGKQHAGEALWHRAQEVMSPDHPGDWNQATMELGAVICTPQTPCCSECPITKWCKQRGNGERKQKKLRRRKHLDYGLALRGQSVWLVQRDSESSLMAGMWELPQIATHHTAEPILRLRHSITDTEYTIGVHTLAAAIAPGASGKWIKRTELHRLPITGLARKVLRRLGVITVSV